MPTCNNCKNEGNGHYCATCGQPYFVKRITIGNLLHEVLHTFTHLDKGFGYTLKELAIRPGIMQRNYLDGERSRHQKPFSMFFLSATITGIALYLTGKAGSDASSHFDETREDVIRHYYVFIQAILLPFYAFTTWLLFRNKKLNYAESIVLFNYASAFMFYLVILANLINLMPHHINTRYFEIPVLAGYLVWTNINFFKEQPLWLVVIKSIINLVVGYLVSNFVTGQLINRML
jgi:Protein of unknown function (DUF3667)